MTKPIDPVRFAIIGSGRIASAYAAAFNACEIANVVAVCDTNLDAARGLAETLNCPEFTSHIELCDSIDIDAAIICTPPSTHRDISLDLVDRRVHVLCEKPLAVDSRSAREMIATADARGTILTMASKFRFSHDVIKAKAIITSGILGDIVLFENTFAARVDMSHRWNARPSISGGGVLIDNGTHSVDIMRFLFGPIIDLQAFEGRRVQGLQVEDTVRMIVRGEHGVTGNIDLSWSINKEQPHYISIYGSEGTVLVGWNESKYRRSSDHEWIVFGSGYDKVAAFRAQIENFARSIRGEAVLVVTPEDALASVEVIEAAYADINNATWQRVGFDDLEWSHTSANEPIAVDG
ncbi:MAG: Gfo/Idh/MocA family oxidoreductase [Planctomycetota bacterium]|nr:Gfo/Idh/MocA family oxidoreductase [Planctomycetota bacterium]